jgi:hypothetical protein
VLAEAFGAVLRVAHAASIDMPPYFTGAQLEALEGERRATRGRLANDLLAFTAPSTCMPVEVIVEEGSAADTILRLAAASALIVVGTQRLRGRAGGGWDRSRKQSYAGRPCRSSSSRPAPRPKHYVAAQHSLRPAGPMPRPSTRGCERSRRSSR